MPQQFTYETPFGIVHIIGEQPRIIDNPQLSYEQALSFGAARGKIAQLIVASDGSKTGHKSVYPARYEEPTFWDGAVASAARSAIVMQTADCPAIILTNKISGDVALVHAGRPALDGPCTVVNNALHAVLGGYTGAENVEALVVGNICGHCFKHDREEAKPLIEYFLRLPEIVFADKETGGLDLYEVIRHNLTHLGVPAENINQAGPCTFETKGLSSYRREKTPLRNTIILVLF